MKIKNKVVIIILVIAILISGISFFGYGLTTRESNRLVYEQTANYLEVLSKKLESQLSTITNSSLNAALETTLQDNLETIADATTVQEIQVARKEILSIFYRFIKSDMINVIILPPKGSPIIWGENSLIEKEGQLYEVAEMAAIGQGRAIWLPTGDNDSSVFCARQIRQVKGPTLKPLGTLIIRVNLDKIMRDVFKDGLKGKGFTINIYSKEILIYPTNPESHSQLLGNKTKEEESSTYRIEKVNGERFFITPVSIGVADNQWDLVLGIPYNDVFNALFLSNIYYSACVLVAIIIAVFLARILFNSMTKQFGLLSQKMNRIRNGNLEVLMTKQKGKKDELSILNKQFDEMTLDFKKVIEDNYVKELLLAQTQLKSLESQVNPHFLYNSLENINWFAKRSGEKNIPIIVGSLATLLRTSLDKEDLVTVEKELKILNSYIEIQKIRFSDTLFITEEIEEALMPCLLPKMSLQPLVDNAIVHSLQENIGDCNIYIRIFSKGDMVRVEIENNGSEINENILELLREDKIAARGNGIGLINIDSRIKLLFGKEYGLSFSSNNSTVIVSFELPKIKRESDCRISSHKYNF